MPPSRIGRHAPPQRGRCPGIRVRTSDLQNRRKRQCFQGQHSSEGASVFSHGWSGDRIAVGAQPVVSVFSSGLALKGRHNSRTVSPSKGSMSLQWRRVGRLAERERCRDFPCLPLKGETATRPRMDSSSFHSGINSRPAASPRLSRRGAAASSDRAGNARRRSAGRHSPSRGRESAAIPVQRPLRPSAG